MQPMKLERMRSAGLAIYLLEPWNHPTKDFLALEAREVQCAAPKW